jgi:positive regulator of sigma E activity
VSCKKTVEVVSVSQRSLMVKPVDQSLCPVCQELGRCRSDWLRRKSAHQTFEIPIYEPILVSAGDVVVLEIDEQALTTQMIKLYGLPLLGLVIPIAVGRSEGWSEVVQALTAVVGLGLGWLSSRHWTRGFQIRINQ